MKPERVKQIVEKLDMISHEFSSAGDDTCAVDPSIGEHDRVLDYEIADRVDGLIRFIESEYVVTVEF
jgi:hypothetical protein